MVHQSYKLITTESMHGYSTDLNLDIHAVYDAMHNSPDTWHTPLHGHMHVQLNSCHEGMFESHDYL